MNMHILGVPWTSETPKEHHRQNAPTSVRAFVLCLGVVSVRPFRFALERTVSVCALRHRAQIRSPPLLGSWSHSLHFVASGLRWLTRPATQSLVTTQGDACSDIGQGPASAAVARRAAEDESVRPTVAHQARLDCEVSGKPPEVFPQLFCREPIRALTRRRGSHSPGRRSRSQGADDFDHQMLLVCLLRV